MDNVKIDSIIEYMSTDEIRNKVLSHYNYKTYDINNIKFKNTDKQRAVFKVNSDSGLKCLKKVYYDEGNLLFIYSVIEWLNMKNILCPRLLSTKEGHKFVKYNDDLFILTDWIDGRKCDYNNLNDIILMSRNLGKIHKHSKGFRPIEGSIIKNSDSTFYTSQYKHFNSLLDFWNSAIHINDAFSRLYIEMFEYNYGKARESIDILSTIDFSRLLGDEVSNHAICHLDYVNKNIIFTKDETIYLIDFDNTRIDMPVHDICYFLRRILKRDDTAWDFNVFKAAMESYEKIRPLSKAEYKVILALLLFPQKYWKVSRDYYKNRKVCNPAPFLNMLKKASYKQTEHNKFCEELKNYIENKY